MNDVVSSDSVTLLAVWLLMTTRRLSCPSYESKLDDTPIQELPHSDIDSASLEEGVILGWVWGQGERQHGVGTHLWLRRHEVPRTMNGTGYSGQVPVKVICGVHFRGVGSFGSSQAQQRFVSNSSTVSSFQFH